MRRETILTIWIGGLVLAAALYGIGPERFLDACLSAIDAVDAAFRLLVFNLGAQAFAVVRALTIALYVVFAVLAFLAAQRGQRGVGALVLVSIALAVLVWRPYNPYPAPFARWVVAFALVLVSAIVMTQRLLMPSMRRHGPWPQNMPPNAPPDGPRNRPP